MSPSWQTHAGAVVRGTDGWRKEAWLLEMRRGPSRTQIGLLPVYELLDRILEHPAGRELVYEALLRSVRPKPT